MKKLLRAHEGKASVAIVVVIIIIAAAGAVIYGAGLFYTTDIGEIKADPSSWEGKEVYIKGTVTDTISFWIFHGFVITESDGDQIYVDWSGDLPTVGDKVIVRGIVRLYFGAVYIEALAVRQAWF